MATYRLVVAYDGTAYHGWQKQAQRPSVEESLEKAISGAFKMPVTILGASRTDAGVHALGQIVRIKLPLDISPEKLLFVGNNSMPPDVLIRKAERVVDDYSPHVNVSKKIYHYYLGTQKPMPFVARYVWYYPRKIVPDRLAEALQTFQGTHDFRSYCSIEDMHDSMVRTVDSLQMNYLQRFNVYRISIIGERFLRHMVRRIVGAAVTVATEGSSYAIEDLQHILYNKNPHHPLPTAPSRGLVLYRIIYHGVSDE